MIVPLAIAPPAHIVINAVVASRMMLTRPRSRNGSPRITTKRSRSTSTTRSTAGSALLHVARTVARRAERAVSSRPLLALPAVGIAVSGLAIAFSEAADKGVDQVLFSGEEAEIAERIKASGARVD